jgi:hypothetical protein
VTGHKQAFLGGTFWYDLTKVELVPIGTWDVFKNLARFVVMKIINVDTI